MIVALETVEELNEIKKYLPKEIYLEISDGRVGLIMNKGATKWNGIKELLKQYKIKSEETIAFGDDNNDIEMIEKCGIGIAMENGIDEIKNKAKYICGENENDGIANWIEENILENV